jgi:hypothetical protein
VTNETDPPANDAGAGGQGETAEAEQAAPKMGRPTKLTQALIKTVREGLLEGLSPELASERAHITRRTYLLWRAQGEKDDEAEVESLHADFFHTVTQARAEFAFDACKWLKKNRDTPSKDISAPTVLFMLERRYAEDFGRREAVELTGKGGGPVQVQTLEDAIALSNGAGATRPDDEPGA